MRKILILLILSACTQMAFAAAQVKIKLSGAINDNRYFLCLPNAGCLSIKAAQKGKIYPFPNEINMGKVFVTDRSNQYRLSPQAIASSCQITVKTDQTVTITGNLAVQKDNSIRINQLRCSLSAG